MPDQSAGIDGPRRLQIPRSRRLTIDVLHYHRQVPLCAHDRLVDLSRVSAARENLRSRVSWSLLFVKAFALVAAKHPVLRQTYMRWPWPHLYQHPYSVAMMATSREVAGEDWLFWSRFTRPDVTPLVAMQRALDRYQSEDVKEVFSRQWQLSALPTVLRRCFWWWTLNMNGSKRAKRSGTFFLSTIASKGAEIQLPPAFLTSNLTYGPMDHDGRSRVTIAYDHRLMDGAFVADSLAELEGALNGPILDELSDIHKSDSRAALSVRRMSA